MTAGVRSIWAHCALFVAVAWLGASPALANLTFSLRTGDSVTGRQSMVVDSNKCPSQGPTAMYVGGLITNTSGTTLTNVQARISGLNANIYLAGGQPVTEYVGSLSPGASLPVYWFTGYSCAIGATATPTITITSDTVSATQVVFLTIRSAISANAGGAVVGSNLGQGAVVGQTIYFDTDYDFGGSTVGDEFFLQPAGKQTFDAACFRLVGTEILRSNVTAAPVGTRNRLYFIQTSVQTGNNYFISVRYFYEYLCAGKSTSARPYAVQTSGNTNIKYTGNFDGAGSVSISFPNASNPFTITKQVNEPKAFVGTTGNLTYTVTVSNPSAYDAIISSLRDTLPAGMSYVGLTTDSAVQAGNSSALPAPGATGAIEFVGRRGVSYVVPARGSLILRYLVTRPGAVGDYINTAQGVMGSATTPTAQATYSEIPVEDLSVTKVSTVHSDPVNGTSNTFAIPGSVMEYTISVTNPNELPLDADSILVTDAAPGQARMCLNDISGVGPVRFVDGGNPSGMTFTYVSLGDAGDDLLFSNDGGVQWDYVPVPDSFGCDGGVTNIRINPKGAFAAKGNFRLHLRFMID